MAAAAAFNVRGRTNYRLHFLARNPARGSKRSHRKEGGREEAATAARRGCDRHRSGVARVYHYRRRRSVSFRGAAAAEFSFSKWCVVHLVHS